MNRARDAIRFRLQLQGISPSIWREILVPARYSFWDLHVAIQDAMGWQDCHLHEFRIPLPGGELVCGIPGEGDELLPYEVFPGWMVAVADVLYEAGDQARYLYDFGDDWMHELELLGIERRVKGEKYPRCVAGERACPPEDCGGAPGYEELLRILANPRHPEYEDMLEWLDDDWSPERFEPSAVRFDNPKRRWRYAFE